MNWGTDTEEKEWANYRINEGKGVLMWDNLNGPFSQNTMGYASSSNINRTDFENHVGFTERRNISYGESHDEERVMYKNILYGTTNGVYNVKTLSTALERQKAFGAVLLSVPGPKMIWQFGELGYDLGINRCPNGTYSTGCRTDPKPSAFDPSLNYFNDSQRKAIYDIWTKILAIRLNNDVFNSKTFEVNSGDLLPRIYIWNDALPSSALKNVVVLANFTISSQNVIPYFPYTGTWYNLMNNTSISVTNTSTPITLQPGEFRIFGNATALATTEVKTLSAHQLSLEVVQNPIANKTLHIRFRNAQNAMWYLYDMTGKMLASDKIRTNSGEERISVHEFSSGAYMLMLKSEQGVAVNKVMIP